MRSGVHVRLVLRKKLLVDGDLGGSKRRRRDKLQGRVANELASKPQEGLLEVVVRLSRNVVVLEVLLAVEGDGLRLDLTLLHVDLVSAENDRDVLAHTDEVTVPVGDVLVRDSGSDIKHDDSTLAVDVVSVAETTKLLLTGSVPHIELELTEIGEETKRVNLDTKGGNVLLLELSGQVALDEGGLSRTTVTDEDQLESGNVGSRGGHFVV